VLREVLQTKRAVAPLVVFAHQGHVQARHRRAASARRTAEFRCASPGRAVDVRVSTLPLGARRARGAALAGQTGRAPSSSLRLGMDPRTQEIMDEIIHKAARHHFG